jgi:carboxypeptidase Taq
MQDSTHVSSSSEIGPTAADTPDDYRALLERFAEISDLGRARALLAWDERTMMPPSGAEGRAEQLTTLSRIRHQRLTDDRLWDLIEGLAEWAVAAADRIEADVVRMARRQAERARRVPADLRAELTRAASLGEMAWAAARESSDLDAYLPHLERNIRLRQQYADCFAPYEHRYDPLLEEFEPGMPTRTARRVLTELREGLVPIVAAVAERPDAVDSAPLEGRFERAGQERLARRVLGLLPLPDDGWRLDPTRHPFATSIADGDIRLTTRYIEDNLSTSLFSVLHEAGHGIYEAGVPAGLRRTPIGHPSSLGFHESQSRLWENWVGRSRAFTATLLPILREEFPGRFDAVTSEQLYRAANRSRPSLIRVEADEVTYNLHIALRFELELELIEGALDAADLAGEWNRRTREYFGIEVPDHARGLMQDVHWAAGLFGYFPTYSLGNVVAAQLWEAMADQLGDPEEMISGGELAALRRWLAERVHRHGARYLPSDLAERALGGQPDPAALLRRLRRKYGELYSF